MSKINQIQTELKSIDDAKFQKLCDAYLHKQGYEQINPLGSFIGADKVTKGTPDTWICLPDGKYLFAEYTTTAQNGLYNKFQKDISNCFDVAKTGMPVEKIREIILCFNAILKPDEHDLLVEQCRANGCLLTPFNIGQISFDLYNKYPGLAKDFLGVEIDTGQIMSQKDFVAAYDKGTFTTPLNTIFQFRQEEIRQVLQALDSSDLVILSGRPGAGKTRLALECCSQFLNMHDQFQGWCIYNREVNLFDDVRVYFTPPGSYLIFADDANRASHFEYILQLLHEVRPDRKVKVIATVRDYALNKVRDVARNYGFLEVDVPQLKDEQIKQLVQEQFGIRHYMFLDRIAEVARGNPRLAIMAGQIVNQRNTLDSIFDVSTIYDEYFRSVRQDLEELTSNNVLKVAGIIAFFRSIVFTNEEFIQTITNVFHISSEALFEAAQQLHAMEVLDKYENEVFKVSDQVLATYLFYLAVFKERVLDFSLLLEHYFPHFHMRFVDALNPVLNTFDGKALIEQLRPIIDHTWSAMQERKNEKGLFKLIDVFWFVDQTKTLLYVRDAIRQLSIQTFNLQELIFKPSGNIPSDSLLNLLRHFRTVELDNCRIAIELVLEYLTKVPSEAPHVIHIFAEPFGFHHLSYLRVYEVQQAVIDALTKRLTKENNEFWAFVYLAVGAHYLHTHYTTSEGEAGELAISPIRFDLVTNSSLSGLRRTIWKCIIALYHNPSMQDEVIEVLHRYTQSSYEVADADAAREDAQQVLPFIADELDPSIYSVCVVVQDYIKFLQRQQVEFPDELAQRFTNDTYTLAQVLLYENLEEQVELGWEVYQAARQKQLAEYVASYQLEDYIRFFEHCRIISVNSKRSYPGDPLQASVGHVLVLLAERDTSLFIEVLKYYWHLGNPFSFFLMSLPFKLVEVLGPEQAYQLLMGAEYTDKHKWLLAFYQALSPAQVRLHHLTEIYSLYKIIKAEDLLFNADYLLKYLPLDTNVLIHVTEIILNRAEQNKQFNVWLEGLFNEYSDTGKQVSELFCNNVSLLKRAYCAAQESRQHVDYNRKAFNTILDLDPSFASEYVEWLYRDEQEPSRYDDSRPYGFVWRRKDYEQIMDGAIEHLFVLEQEKRLYRGSYLSFFFLRHEGDTLDEAKVAERKKDILKKWIAQKHADADFIRWLFKVIVQYSSSERTLFIEHFLKYNQNFNDFRKIDLEAGVWMTSGSHVPVLQGRVDFWETLLPLLNTINLLEHRQYVHQRIASLREEIEHEKKQDFLRE